MFLADIHLYGLIPSSPEEDILSAFPVAIKRTLVKSVVDELHRKEQLRLSGGELNTVITTPAHAEWILECIGQGFRLPFNDGSILNTLFRLYHIWLFNNWPLGMQPRTQHFFRKIGLHFSLLFELRKDDQGIIKESDQIEDARCRFCFQALKEIYLPIVRLFGPTFSKKTWDAYLKILLVITDTVLKSESKKVVSHLATFSLRVLFEVWFLAKTQDEELWGALRKLAVEHEWRDRTISVVHQLNEINFALTLRVMNVLYGEQFGAKEIEINFALDAALSQHEVFGIDFSTEDLFFYWHKFLNLIANHARIKSPDIYHLAFLGVERVVDSYLSLTQFACQWDYNDPNYPPKFIPPNSSVILNIYGNWLFEACDNDKPCFEQGTAVAIRTLSKIILHAVNFQQILPRHLSSYYHSVGMICSKLEHNIVSHSLLMSSRSLFTQNIYGSSILIPHYLHSLNSVWGANRFPPEEVGIAATEILISLVCFQNVYWQAQFAPLPFKRQFEERPDLIGSYIQILPTIQKILRNALIYEKEVRTLELLVWCFSITLSELFDHFSAQGERLPPNDQQWVEYVFTDLLLEKVVSGGWQNRVSIVVLETFTFIASQSGANISKYIDTSELSIKLIRGLSSKINKLASSSDDETIYFIAGCFKCIGEWVTCNEAHSLWNSDYSVGQAVMTAIKTGLESQHFQLQDAATQLWGLLFNMTDSHAGAGVSSLLTEIDFLAETATRMGRTNLRGHELWQDYGQTCRIFSLNGNIVSIVDVPELPGQIGPPRVNMILRTPFGKFVWSCQMNLFGDNADLPYSVIGTNPTKIELVPPVVYGCTPIPEVVTFQDIPDIMHRTEWLLDQTSQYLQSINYGLEVPIDYMVPWRLSSELWEPQSCGKSHYTRMFLAHMGLLNQSTFEEINFLSFNESLVNELKELDKIPEREVSNVSVLFWGKGQKTRHEIFSNLIGTHRFHEFLDSLGWIVNLDTHTTYKGDAPNYEIAAPWGLPYWCDSTHEILFEPSILFENTPKVGSTMDPAMAVDYKREILVKNFYCIVWLEDEHDLNYNFIEDTFVNKYYIIIVPLSCGLFRVDIKTFDHDFFFLRNAVVSRHILALHVRRIIKIFHNIQNSKTDRYYNIFWAQPSFLFRKQAMKTILQNHESHLSYSEQLYSLMTSAIVDIGSQPRAKKPIPRPVVVKKPEEKEKSVSVANIAMQHAPVNEPTPTTFTDKPSSRSKKPKIDIKKGGTKSKSDKHDAKPEDGADKPKKSHSERNTPREHGSSSGKDTKEKTETKDKTPRLLKGIGLGSK